MDSMGFGTPTRPGGLQFFWGAGFAQLLQLRIGQSTKPTTPFWPASKVAPSLFLKGGWMAGRTDFGQQARWHRVRFCRTGGRQDGRILASKQGGTEPVFTGRMEFRLRWGFPLLGRWSRARRTSEMCGYEESACIFIGVQPSRIPSRRSMEPFLGFPRWFQYF